MDQSRKDDFILTAADVVARKVAQGVLPRSPGLDDAVLCFQSSVLQAAARKNRAARFPGLPADAYLFKRGDRRVLAVGGFGVGGPAAVALLEELAAFGMRRLLAIGLAGSLQPNLAAGDLVVCDRARRDEGTSFHYLGPGEWVAADPALAQSLCLALQSRGHSAAVGSTWTTDAPFRESREQAAQYRQAGILTVEMEAASLFAAGEGLGVAVGAAFAIADSPNTAPLDFDRGKAARGLEILFETALAVLYGDG
jgi:purine-nucleoside phosphorylase